MIANNGNIFKSINLIIILMMVCLLVMN